MRFDTARSLLIEAARKEREFITNALQSGHRGFAEITEASERYAELITASDHLLEIEQKEGEHR